MFPIHILENGTELPKSGTFYVVASNGIFLHKETGLVRALVRVDGISFLEELKATASLKLPKLLPELMVRTLLFFRSVYRKHGSEAVVLLHYSTEQGRYLLWCPEQEVSAAGVDYESTDRFDGHQLVGTIHSHNNFNAFHSGIDINDERCFDGVHITIGRVDQPYFNISCCIVVNNNRFRMEPGNVIAGIKKVDWKPTLITRHRRRAVQRTRHISGSRGLWPGLMDLGMGLDEPDEPDDDDEHGVVFSFSPRVSQFYDMVLPDGKDYRHVGFPKEWMEKVERKTLVATFVGGLSPFLGKATIPVQSKGGNEE